MSRKKRKQQDAGEEIPVHFGNEESDAPDSPNPAEQPPSEDVPGCGDADPYPPVNLEGETTAPPAEEDYQAKYLRVLAEFQNYKKRTAKESAQSARFANEQLIKELLSVIDDMERALAAARENHGEDDPFFTGMQLVHDNMLSVLSRFGVSIIEAEGQPFDPEKHAALMQEESDAEPMTVLRQLQRGYELKGRTLRPASVVVAKPKSEE